MKVSSLVRMLSLQKNLLSNFGNLKEALNSSSQQEILCKEVTPHFATITINRPNALNALNMNMIRTLTQKVQDFNYSQSKVILFTGLGGKAFCAGGDVKALYEAKQKNEPSEKKILDNFFREEYILDNAIRKMKPLQISAYEGIVMGGGVGLSIYSKAKIATANTLFAMPEAKIGLFTDISASYFLSRLPKKIGLYLALTGARLKGVELVQAGLANYYLTPDKLSKLKTDLASKITESINEKELAELIGSYEEPYDHDFALAGAIEEFFEGESLKEIFEKLENNKKIERQEFCKKTLEMMREQCPFSLRIIFDELKKGREMEVEDCFKMEFRLTQRFMENPDFYEGVRCTLVDKKATPNWRYKSPFDVPQEEIDRYFSKLPENLELHF